jgi:hypothetical protein
MKKWNTTRNKTRVQQRCDERMRVDSAEYRMVRAEQ